MKIIRSLVLAVLLTFIAVSLLMAALQYTSDQIGVRIQNETNLPTDVKVNGLTNSTGDDSPDNAGSLQADSPNGEGSGFGIINLSSLSFASGGNPKKPDAPQDPTNYVLIIIIILVVLAFLALIGYLIWRRRRHGKKTPLIQDQGAATGISPGSFEGDYKICFPQIREPFPVIWGEGEALEIIIECKEGAKDDAVLDFDGKASRDVRLENGMTRLRLELGKGDHRIMVSAKDGAGSQGPSWAVVRIVDYREEIVRMFNEMYLNYSSRYEGMGDKMTPRELERAIGLNLPEAKRKALGVAVTVFEFANYSLHAIRRRDYERMYLSKMDVT
jgi:uncharacterized protein YxeA